MKDKDEKRILTAISPEWKDNLRSVIDSVNLKEVFCTESKNNNFDFEILASNSIGYKLISHKQEEKGIPGQNVILQFSPPCYSANKEFMFLINYRLYGITEGNENLLIFKKQANEYKLAVGLPLWL